jgi:RNA polymerase sigma factor (sigma-70 family)
MFERQYRPVLAYALRRTSHADADDVVAETFVVAWRRLDDVPSGEGELPWLLAVARRTLANQRRSRQRADRLALRLADEPSASTAAEGDRVAAVEALARLRPLDREVLLLAAWDGLTHRQIAAMFGCSENAVSIRLHRTRRRLAEELDEQFAQSGGRDG